MSKINSIWEHSNMLTLTVESVLPMRETENSTTNPYTTDWGWIHR